MRRTYTYLFAALIPAAMVCAATFVVMAAGGPAPATKRVCMDVLVQPAPAVDLFGHPVRQDGDPMWGQPPSTEPTDSTGACVPEECSITCNGNPCHAGPCHKGFRATCDCGASG